MGTKDLYCPRNDNAKQAFSSTKDEGSIGHFAYITLRAAVLLLESGAHCERINRNIQRIASKTPYEVEMFFSFTTVSISIHCRDTPLRSVTLHKRVKHHGVHYGIISKISLLTWKIFEDKLPLSELSDKIDQISVTPRYSLWCIRLFIGLACACLCLLAGGSLMDGFFAFFASICGIIARQWIVGKGFNLMIAVALSSFVTTTIAGIDILYSVGNLPVSAIATSVLFLIPGVPLINCIIDLLEGYIPTALARGAFGGFILLCIAVGMFLSMNLIGVNNF